MSSTNPDQRLRIIRDHPSLYNFQKCSINPHDFPKLAQQLQTSLESYCALKIDSKNLRILTRISPTNFVNDTRWLKSDFRVLELLPGSSTETDVQDDEAALAQYLSKDLKASNETLQCSPNNLTILKPGSIRSMKCTLITSADLKAFNSLSSQSWSPCQIGVNPKARGSFETCKLLAEKLRDILLLNEIHLKGRTLIDLRDCPLSSSPPYPLNFIFVQEVTFKNSEQEIGRIKPNSHITISQIHHISHYERLAGALSFSETLFGLEGPSQLLSNAINLRNKMTIPTPHGLLIAGPRGSGKTALVRQSAKKMRAELMAIDSSELLNPQNLSNIFNKALNSSKYYPTVLLIENIEFLNYPEGVSTVEASGKMGGSNGSKRMIVDQLAEFLDSIPPSNALTVIGTSIQPHRIPGKIRRSGRLDQEIYIRAPNEDERLQILTHLTRNNPAFGQLDLGDLARSSPGYVPADLIRLVQLALLKSSEDGGSGIVEESHVKYATSRVLPSVLTGSLGLIDIRKGASLNSIAGLDSVKLDLIKAIIWPLKHPESFLKMGISPPKGILLYGPPGCAKTTLVRALGSSYNINFLSVTAAELFSSGVGDSEKIVSQLFQQARLASPCILFIDELESIVGSRQGSSFKSKSTNESILTTLLTEMDGIGIRAETIPNSDSKDDSILGGPRVVVVGATNRPQLIDSALLRPGRFDRIIPVPPPDEGSRKELLVKTCSNTPLSPNVDFERIAAETAYYSGADLVNLVREAALYALAEDIHITSLSMEHFIMAKDGLSPSLSQETLRSFHEYGKDPGERNKAFGQS